MVGDASAAVAADPRGHTNAAQWYALVGQDELAIREIQRAYDAREVRLLSLPAPVFSRLRSDPRVQAVAREFGIRW